MSLINEHTNDIERLCRKHKVKSLYAFGSVLAETFNDDSDVDLLVDFEPLQLTEYAQNYFGLKFSLQGVFKRRIDLLEAKAIKNPYFIQAIENQKKLIYGCSN
jgi:uncharacterized protein